MRCLAIIKLSTIISPRLLRYLPCTTLLNSEECALSEKKKKKKIFSYYSCTTAVRYYWNVDIIAMMSSVHDEPKPGYDNACLVSLKHDGTARTAENR